MDLSSIRSALNGFDSATPVFPADLHGPSAGFLLGDAAPSFANTAPIALDLNAPNDWAPPLMDDFTQSDVLEIDYACGEPEPELSLFFNTMEFATEVRLDGVCVAMVRMRMGMGPLRASAIRLIPDLALAADVGAA
ncbi:MAG: hypothetical protein U5N55_03090 [Cypionkella sp.]|nr:hypothetical protein [Cypionkella sp.]